MTISCIQQNQRYQENNTQQNHGSRIAVSPWENRQPTPNTTNPLQQQQSSMESMTNAQHTPKETKGDFENMKTFLEQCLEKMKSDITKQIEHQIDSKINSFANKPVYQPAPTQWYHPKLQHPNIIPQHAQIQPEKPQENANTSQVSFMGYPMIIPQKS